MSTTPRRDRGLTLIELIVVIAILVVLTGLALPKLDVFKLKANKAQAASNMFAVNQWVTAYWSTHDQYPDIWDSLMEDNGGSPSQLFSELHPSLTGAPGGTAKKLAVATQPLTANQVQSLARVGLAQVVDHKPGNSIPGNSGDFSTKRDLATGANYVSLNFADTTGKVDGILKEFYPSTNGVVPSGKSILVVGLGRTNEMIGDILHAAPFYANADQLTQYNRMLVLFEMDDGGGRAKLIGSLASDGDRFEGEIQDFYKS